MMNEKLLYGYTGLFDTPDEIIEINSNEDFYKLNKYSKFSFGELPTHKNQKKKNSK